MLCIICVYFRIFSHLCLSFLFEGYGDHRDLHVLTHSFPTRRSSDLPAPAIVPEVATPLIHAMLDRQYRATLDEPVGMLGDITPRAAVQTDRKSTRLNSSH